MKRPVPPVDLPDALILVGVSGCALTIYWLNWVLVPAFVGTCLILWGLLVALGNEARGH